MSNIKNFFAYLNKVKDSSTTPLGKDGAWITKSGFPLKRMLLPEIDLLTIADKRRDEFAAVFGIERVMSREVVTQLFAPKGSMNRYLIKMYDRLNRYSIEGYSRKFWSLSKILLKHSTAYRLVCLFRVEDRWYKRLHHKFIGFTFNKVGKLARRLSTHYRYKRVMIEKIPGSGIFDRPLAVPQLPWRVYANMQYNLLWIWLRNQDPISWQHGGRPERGVNSAWKALWKIIKSPTVNDLFEYDLTKFFDRVDTSTVLRDALAWKRIPVEMQNWLIRSVQDAKGDQNRQVLMKEYEKLKDSMSSYDVDSVHSGSNHLANAAFFDGYESGNTSRMNQLGVPQGYSLSPILACLTVEYMFAGFEKLAPHPEEFGEIIGTHFSHNNLMYMDDGIIFANHISDFDMEVVETNFRYTGTEINPEKSRWLKRDGKWLVDSFKFLGVVYDVKSDTLTSKTKSGKSVTFPIADLDKYNLVGPSGQVFLRYVKEHHPIDVSIGYKFFDAILANMFCGGEIKNSDQGTLLIANPLSFVSYYMDKVDFFGGKFPGTDTQIGTNIYNASTRAAKAAAQVYGHKNRVSLKSKFK